MAIPQTLPSGYRFPPAPLPDPAQELRFEPATSDNSSHALKIYDGFEPAPPGPDWLPPHGLTVTRAARSTGYAGSIVVEQQQVQEKMAPLQGLLVSQMALPGSDREGTLEALDQFVKNNSMALMLRCGMDLDKDHKAGVTGAVTNFSLGFSAADSLSQLYGWIRQGWSPAQEGEQPQKKLGKDLIHNLASAWELDESALHDPDPKVHGPARAAFQQKLIDQVQKSQQSPEVRQVQDMYSQTVKNYEAGGNSVVVAAGNSGTLLDQMKADNGGQELQIPENFFRNVLASPDTTVVGATGVRRFDENFYPVHEVAPYSTREGVTIYASGDTPEGQGTSFAAPRVAAVMAELHQANPHLTSAQIENLARQRFSDQPDPSQVDIVH